MNVLVLIALAILLAISLWFLLSPMFKPIGTVFTTIWKNAINEMKEENVGKKGE